jgi:hypothetical protein
MLYIMKLERIAFGKGLRVVFKARASSLVANIVLFVARSERHALSRTRG